MKAYCSILTMFLIATAIRHIVASHQGPTSTLMPLVGLKAQALSPTAIVLTWEKSDDLDCSSIVGCYYTVQYRYSNESMDGSIQYHNTTDSLLMLDGLLPNFLYKLRVKLTAGDRESAWSMVTEVRTLQEAVTVVSTTELPPTLPPVPPAPIDVKVESISSSVIHVTWSDQNPGIQDDDYYVVRYQLINAAESQYIVTTEMSCTISNLASDALYKVSVRRNIDGEQSKWSESVQVRTKTPEKVCEALTDLAHGKVEKSFGVRSEEILVLSCNPGYVLSGPDILTCDKLMQQHAPSCLPKDCLAHFEAGRNISGVYGISLDGVNTVFVFCDMSNGGWTVIQKRQTPDLLSFDRTWDEYKHGFGNPTRTFWLGLENMHLLTNVHSQLQISVKGSLSGYVQYDWFKVGSELDRYKIRLNSYATHGYINDPGFGEEDAMYFSTMDQDNDEWRSGNCAKREASGWWFKECRAGEVNLNGLYCQKSMCPAIYWPYSFGYSLNFVEMKVRRKKII